MEPSNWCSRLRKTTFFENRASRNNRKSYRLVSWKIGTFPVFCVIGGDQKSSKMMTFSQHGNIDLHTLYTANLSIWGPQNQTKTTNKI